MSTDSGGQPGSTNTFVKNAQKVLRGMSQGTVGNAAVKITKHFVQTWARKVTIEQIREKRAAGAGFLDLPAGMRGLLIEVVKRAPQVPDEVGYHVVIDWVAEVNPVLASQIVGDVPLMKWASRTWQAALGELRGSAEAT